MRSIVPLAALLSAPAAQPAPPAEPGISVVRVDPATVDDADFARHRAERHWRGLTVELVTFREGPATWRLWRIVNRRRPDGPLWVAPHDNEHAAFSAGLASVRRWGGSFVAVDTGPDDESAAARYNRATADGRRIDPNRAFTPDAPLYTAQVLATRRADQPIIALHTNPRGFSPRLTPCDPRVPGDGSGEISVLICDDTYAPRPSRRQRWPFDDADTLALYPVHADRPGATSWCRKAMRKADFNLVEERVAERDGSLSNHALDLGLPYVNFETRERGADPVGLADARDRLVFMARAVMKRCRSSSRRT